jgi:hypothetical protein
MLGTALSFFNIVHIVLMRSQHFTNACIPNEKIPLTVCIATHAPAVELLRQIGETVHQELP